MWKKILISKSRTGPVQKKEDRSIFSFPIPIPMFGNFFWNLDSFYYFMPREYQNTEYLCQFRHLLFDNTLKMIINSWGQIDPNFCSQIHLIYLQKTIVFLITMLVPAYLTCAEFKSFVRKRKSPMIQKIAIKKLGSNWPQKKKS